ncbi:unnamed protein product [Symbiodinium sp. KB8]|nr:unnamed protein product [Symbiodinium sp. KB8]
MGPGALLALRPPRTLADNKKPGAWSAKAGTKLPRPEEAGWLGIRLLPDSFSLRLGA